jgi:hypothetical protein
MNNEASAPPRVRAATANARGQPSSMKTYRFFALDATGRVDRGFERRFPNDAAAIEFAKLVEDATTVEILNGRDKVAQVVIRNGRVSVFEGP